MLRGESFRGVRGDCIVQHLTIEARFCTECGAELVEGVCAEHGVPSAHPLVSTEAVPASQPQGDTGTAAKAGKGRRAVRRFLTTILALLVGALALVVVDLRSDLDLERRVARVATRDLKSLKDALNAFNTRVAALEKTTNDAFDPAKIAAQVRAGVFTVTTKDGLGTAFVVKSSPGASSLLTAYHVIRGTWLRSGKETVRLSNSEGTFEGRVTQVSVSNDAALIEVSSKLQLVPLAESVPKPGAPVMVIASQAGLTGSVSTGSASGLRDGLMQFSAEVGPGSSGGPLIDGKGRAVGLIVSKFVADGIEGLSFAVPLRDVCLAIPIC